MGWEWRGSQRFYYRKRRVGRRVVSRYVGGEARHHAGLAALADEVDRGEAAAARREELEVRARLEAADAGFLAWHRQVGQLAARVVRAAGYHRHDRGRWRKRRGPMGTAPNALHDGDLGQLARLAARDDGEAAEVLRSALAADPRAFRGLALAGGDGELLAADAADALLSECCGDDVHRRARVEVALRQLREELEGPRPTVLERLLASRVVMSWLHMQVVELWVAAEPHSDRQDWCEKRLERAQRLYLQAIKGLAEVRRLQLPTMVQVNVAGAGGRQVNVAGH